MKKIGIIILIFKRLYIHVNSKKKKKIKSENKSEFKNVKIGIHMMRKFRYNSHMKIKKYKIHSYELSK